MALATCSVRASVTKVRLQQLKSASAVVRRGSTPLLAPNLPGKLCRRLLFTPDGPVDPILAHPSQKFVFVRAGTVELEYGDHAVTLAAGDSAYFDAPVSYHLRAGDAVRAKVVVVAHIDPSGDRG
jgi:quercetin dioxygenase-like cupin family protein